MKFVSYAQNFEDVMLWRALKHVQNGFYVDIGAAWPDNHSVTKSFYHRGWRGINIEPNIALYDLLKTKRPDDINLNISVGSEPPHQNFYVIENTGLSTLNADIAAEHSTKGWEVKRVITEIVSLDRIWDQYVCAHQVHFIKIDVEGHEGSVLQSNDWSRHRPWIVVIEATHPLSSEERHEPWESILLNDRYILAYEDGLNLFYVAEEHAHLLSAFKYPPNVFDDFTLAAQEQAESKYFAAESQRQELEARLQLSASKRQELEMRVAGAEGQSHYWKTMSDSLSRQLQDVFNSWSWRSTGFLRWGSRMSLLAGWRSAGYLRFFLRRLRPMAGSISTLAILRTLRHISRLFSVLLSFVPRRLKDDVQTSTISRVGVAAVSSDIILLTEDYSVGEPTWLAYLESAYKAHLNKPEKGANIPSPDARLLVCICPPSSGRDCANGHSWIETFRELSKVSDYDIEFIWCDTDSTQCAPSFHGGSSWRQTSIAGLCDFVKDNDIVLFLQAGDEVRPEMTTALRLYGCFYADFSVFDFYFRDNSHIYPFLLHGIDPLHYSYCDYFLSRFCMRGSAIKQLRNNHQPIDSPRAIAGAYMTTIAAKSHPSAVHIPLPLVCVNVSLDYIRRERKSLAEHWYCKSPIASETYIGESEAPVFNNDNCTTTRISVIICTKDNANLLRLLVGIILPETRVSDVVIVSNNTSNCYSLAMLESLKANDKVTVISYNKPFNFSAQSNLGAKHAKGNLLLFMNDDIVPVTDSWLPFLLESLDGNPRRIVGPLLLYPNETIQHGGMYLGFNGVAGHTLRNVPYSTGGCNFMLSAPRHVSCLTGAAMLMTKDLFSNLNGFDTQLASYLQDVDYCMRALHSGADLIFDPRSILFHMESVSLKTILRDANVQRLREREFDYFVRRWGDERIKDRWVNPLWNPADESLRSLRV